jgi:hypothetical protein
MSSLTARPQYAAHACNAAPVPVTPTQVKEPAFRAAPRIPRESVPLALSGVGLLIGVMLLGVAALLFFACQVVRRLLWWALA